MRSACTALRAIAMAGALLLAACSRGAPPAAPADGAVAMPAAPGGASRVSAVVDGKPWQVAGTPVLAIRIGRLATVTTAPAVVAGAIDPRAIQLQFDPDADGPQALDHVCDGSAPCIEFTDARGKHIADPGAHATLRLDSHGDGHAQGTFSAVLDGGTAGSATLLDGRFSVDLPGGG